MRQTDNDLLEAVCEAMTAKGLRAVTNIYGVGNLEGKWIAYHLLNYVTEIRGSNSKDQENLDNILKKKGFNHGIKNIQKLPFENSIATKRSKNVFICLTEFKNHKFNTSKLLIHCVVEFLEYCEKNSWPIIRFNISVKNKKFDPEKAEYSVLDLKEIIGDIRHYIAQQSIEQVNKNSIVKSPHIFLKEPRYAKKKEEVSSNDIKINLDPYDHYSIPLLGRNKQLKLLDTFLSDKREFFILPVIGSSGSGKTRLVTQWLHKHVNRDFENWHAGLLTTADTGELIKWEPTCNTLIIIDYIYRFDKAIELIAEKAEQCTQHKIRLILIDHVYPEITLDLRHDLDLKALMPDRRAYEDRKSFLHQALYLERVDNKPTLLRRIISIASGKPEESETIADALNVLHGVYGNDYERNNKAELYKASDSAAAHPLFAILIGQAIRDGDDISNWKRRDLIDFYLNNERRLPWKYKEKSGVSEKLAGPIIAAATIQRGLSFETISQYLSNIEGINPKDIKAIIKRCNRIITSNNKDWLKPFEPDILGENFFLLFFRECYANNKYLCKIFIDMLCHEINYSGSKYENSVEMSGKFIEFTQRLARNIANDDQCDPDVKEDWFTLSKFLDPELYPPKSRLRLFIYVAIVKVLDILKKSKTFVSDKLFLRNINLDDLILFGEKKYYLIMAEVLFKYYDRIDKKDEVELKLKNIILTMSNNFNIFSMGYSTSLIEASKYDCSKTIGALLDQNDINIDHTDSDGDTAIITASRNGNFHVVKQLLDHGADIKLNERFTSPLIESVMMGNNNISNLLIDSLNNINSIGESEYHAFNIACENGNIEVAVGLMNIGIDINKSNGDGRTPLMHSCRKGHIGLAIILLEYGAEINKSDELGFTALSLACDENQILMIYFIASRGENVNSETEFGTALMIACENNSLDVIQALIDVGADIDLTIKNKTALSIACNNGNMEAIGSLIDAGVDTSSVLMSPLSSSIKGINTTYPNPSSNQLEFEML